MAIFIWCRQGGKIVPRAYKFYESDPVLCEILDELVRDRQLTPTIHNLLINGLGKDIKKTKKALKQRIETIDKVGRMYKRLQTKSDDKKEDIYQKYKQYRGGLEKNDVMYIRDNGIGWIGKKAELLHMKAESLVKEFEERYGNEKNEKKIG